MQDIYVYLKENREPSMSGGYLDLSHKKKLYGTTCGNSKKFDDNMIELSKPSEKGKQVTYHIPKDNILLIEITEPCK